MKIKIPLNPDGRRQVYHYIYRHGLQDQSDLWWFTADDYLQSAIRPELQTPNRRYRIDGVSRLIDRTRWAPSHF